MSKKADTLEMRVIALDQFVYRYPRSATPTPLIKCFGPLRLGQHKRTTPSSKKIEATRARHFMATSKF